MFVMLSAYVHNQCTQVLLCFSVYFHDQLCILNNSNSFEAFADISNIFGEVSLFFFFMEMKGVSNVCYAVCVFS